MPPSEEFQQKEKDGPKEESIKLQIEESVSISKKGLEIYDSNPNTSPCYDDLHILNELDNDIVTLKLKMIYPKGKLNSQCVYFSSL